TRRLDVASAMAALGRCAVRDRLVLLLGRKSGPRPDQSGLASRRPLAARAGLALLPERSLDAAPRKHQQPDAPGRDDGGLYRCQSLGLADPQAAVAIAARELPVHRRVARAVLCPAGRLWRTDPRRPDTA